MSLAFQLSRRPATDADIPFLLALRRATMDAHLEASGIHCTAEDHLARVMHRFDCAEILSHQGEPVGLLKLQRGPDSWEIVQLQLCPSMQGKGAGSHLLQQLIDEANAHRAAITLSVLKTNPARGLYAKLGFQIVGEDTHEYRMHNPHPTKPQRPFGIGAPD